MVSKEYVPFRTQSIKIPSSRQVWVAVLCREKMNGPFQKSSLEISLTNCTRMTFLTYGAPITSWIFGMELRLSRCGDMYAFRIGWLTYYHNNESCRAIDDLIHRSDAKLHEHRGSHSDLCQIGLSIA